jgi:hypothetical protein
MSGAAGPPLIEGERPLPSPVCPQCGKGGRVEATAAANRIVRAAGTDRALLLEWEGALRRERLVETIWRAVRAALQEGAAEE